MALLARSKDAAAAQDAQMAAASSWGELRGEQAATLSEPARPTRPPTAPPTSPPRPRACSTERRSEVLQGAATQTGRVVDDVVAGHRPSPLTTWLDQSAARQQVLREVEATRADEALAAIDAVEASSRQSSTALPRSSPASGCSSPSAWPSRPPARSPARCASSPTPPTTSPPTGSRGSSTPSVSPIDDDEQQLAAALEPIAVRTDDEIGRLAHAFNAVQLVAVDVAAEQSMLLKKGISDLYVNLARRNQALIDRQIQLLDQLEAEEQDTEVLQHLYLLDHLATRMRRNAESLLILAGSESGPRRSKPIEVVDVVRAALSEVEDYERIELGVARLRHPARARPGATSPTSSPSCSRTRPSSRHPTAWCASTAPARAGSYQIVITDRGVGMRQEQLDELNEVLRDPPVTGLALGRALGCLVAARLAARHGITVRLRSTEGEGVVAYVILPQHLLVEEQASEPRPTARPTARRPAPTRAVDRRLAEAEGLATRRRPCAAERPAAPVRLSDALPARSEFDAGIQALLDREGEPTLVEPPLPTREAGRRGRRRGGAPRCGDAFPARPPRPLPEPIVDPPVRRDPDEVRALLSRYRSGLRAGRVSDGPDDEERS